MPLTFESQTVDDVAIIRCKGRIALGPEVQALEEEVDRQTKVAGTSAYRVKRVVLQLAETDFLDSSGLGSLIRLYGVLQAAGGGLKLCEMSAKVLKVIEMTNLGGVFPAYASEAQAIDAFAAAPRAGQDGFDSSKVKIVCVDTSKDLLAELSALLSRSGFEAFTTRYLGDAVTLIKTMRPRVVICGPGMATVPNADTTVENLRQSGKLEVLNLPAGFYTAEAGQAGRDLISQVQALIAV